MPIAYVMMVRDNIRFSNHSNIAVPSILSIPMTGATLLFPRKFGNDRRCCRGDSMDVLGDTDTGMESTSVLASRMVDLSIGALLVALSSGVSIASASADRRLSLTWPVLVSSLTVACQFRVDVDETEVITSWSGSSYMDCLAQQNWHGFGWRVTCACASVIRRLVCSHCSIIILRLCE